MTEQGPPADAAVQAPPRLSLTYCSKGFPGVQALDDVTFIVRPGETHALLGENGAGKSTLDKVIGGVYEPDAGVLTLDGEALRRLDERVVAAAARIERAPGGRATFQRRSHRNGFSALDIRTSRR